ncbi:hypothetical protein [Pseudomonas juntendi]|uniref:hypothetical protein n=1 Tax=Pseudomonas juntendi TaxID=2666183 RepID=UPI00345D815A
MLNIHSGIGHPKIVTGETILSWVCRGLSLEQLENPHLFRMAIQRYFTPGSLEVGLISEWPQTYDSDVEFDESSELISVLQDTYDECTTFIGGYFRSSGLPLTNLHYRNLSCEDCLAHSFFSFRFPVWKKDWCYLTSAYCPEHQRLLTCPPTLPPIESRMWDCYLHNLWRGRSPAKPEERRLALLAGKAQAWIQKRVATHPLESDVLHSLYGLLLSRRTLHAVEGVAASGFGHPPRSPYRWCLNVQDRLDFGMHSANGVQRGGAMLLMGWLLGLYPAKDINNAIHGNRMVRRSLPKNPRMLGSLAARVCTSREEGELIAHQLKALRKYETENIAEFMDGLNAVLLSLR